jgi:hypothetical protein
MNAGAGAASGSDGLFFVHSDSQVTSNSAFAARDALAANPSGVFALGLKFDDPSRQLRVLERLARWRDCIRPYPLGDQGLILARTTFDALGRFPDLPLMEDVEFLRTTRTRERSLRVLPVPLETSARQFVAGGVARTLIRNAALIGLHRLGVSPARLARRYYGEAYVERWERRRRR